MPASACRLSIIVPVLNEAPLIANFLRHVRLRAPAAELIVIDGGSWDRTASLALPLCDRLEVSPPGRAAQMNLGARLATGSILWFLHADSELPPEAVASLGEALRDGALVGGCFRLRFARPEPIYRVSDTLGNWAVDLFQTSLGDHGIFCRRRVFEEIGGYRPVPLLEDAELYRDLRRCGRVQQLRAEILSSARRYEANGPVRTTLLYSVILALYFCRAPWAALAALYRRLDGPFLSGTVAHR